MNQRTDFLLDPDGDFPLEDVYVNGVIQNTNYGNSDNQHIFDDIVYSTGSLKEFPTFGFGVTNYENAEYNNSIFNTLKQVLSQDGYTVTSGTIKSVGNGFVINTSYINNSY